MSSESESNREREFLRKYLKFGLNHAMKTCDFDALFRMISYGVDVTSHMNSSENTVWDHLVGPRIKKADQKLVDDLRKFLELGIMPAFECLDRIFETTIHSYREDRYAEIIYYKLKIIKLLYSFGLWSCYGPRIQLYKAVNEYESMENLHILIWEGVEPNSNFEKLDNPFDHAIVVASKHRSRPYGLRMIKALLEAGCEIFNQISTTPNEFTRRICVSLIAKRSRVVMSERRMYQYGVINMLKLFYADNLGELETKIVLIEVTFILNLLIEHTFGIF